MLAVLREDGRGTGHLRSGALSDPGGVGFDLVAGAWTRLR
jgi:hypothetical protein